MKYSKKPIVLCVDDEPTNLKFLSDILKDAYEVYSAPSGERALRFLSAKTPDLILLDVEMPKMNGYEVIKEIKKEPSFKDIPVIFLTGLEGMRNEQTAFDLGAVDYILKPISSGVVKARIGLQIDLENYRRHMEELVEIRTQQLSRTQNTILDMIANMTSYRDQETGGHVRRTTEYIRIIVERLYKEKRPGYILDPAYGEGIINSAKLHDIGKIAIPDMILLKPAKLTTEEFDIMKEHTTYGEKFLQDAIDELGDTSSFLTVAKEIVIGHHEKWNGRGYPHGLAGSDIPISARMMAIADVYDALVTRRPYKEPFSHETAMDIIHKDAGTHFDPYLVEMCEDDFAHFKTVFENEPDDDYDSPARAYFQY
ncbi:MAG: response regulator [Oscillospiraceae bacterium]|jgi:putative two-component system response regulator|nr:response regulator [Oscillospiraceae bacterium]